MLQIDYRMDQEEMQMYIAGLFETKQHLLKKKCKS